MNWRISSSTSRPVDQLRRKSEQKRDLASRERFEKLTHAKPPSRKGDCAERIVPFEPVHHSASQCDDVAIRRLNQAYPNAMLVHTPVQAGSTTLKSPFP